ncbi:LiaI-LiaF-like domain-containing protein [Trichlorobacter sp.]
MLVTLGILFLLSNHGVIPPLGQLLNKWWPIFMIVPGILILLGRSGASRS